MAGPTVTLLFQSILTDEALLEINSTIQSISGNMDENDFWVIQTEPINGSVLLKEGRPFTLVNCRMDQQFEEYKAEELSFIKELIGFEPQFFLASCNQEIDHLILGELALYIAQKYKGIIDFGGELAIVSEVVRGKIFELPYETASGHTAINHFADAEFMKHWLNSDHFRMIK